MFSHKAIPKNSTIDPNSVLDGIEGPGDPSNLAGDTDAASSGVELNWDEPTSGGPVFFYEIYENNTFLAVSFINSYEVSSPTDQDKYKVRASGIQDLKSNFTSVYTYEADQTLTPMVTGGSHHVAVLWQDISDIDEFDVTGYNVYLDGVKQNSADLGTDINSYPLFNLNSEQEYTFGVSFLYDDGGTTTESSIFTLVHTMPGVREGYQISIDRLASQGLIVSVGEATVGVGVSEGAGVNVVPVYTLRDQHHKPKWKSGGDSYTADYFMSPFPSDRITFNSGCDANGDKVIEWRKTKPRTIEISKDGIRTISGGISTSYSFTMFGPPCKFPRNQWTAYKVFAQSDDIEAVGDYDTDNYSLKKIDKEASDVISYESSFDQLQFESFRGIYCDIYIKAKSDSSYPADPDNGSSKLTSRFFYHDVSSLSAGDYNAKIQYFLADKTTMAFESAEIEFTVS